jgi:hypothetical protein
MCHGQDAAVSTESEQTQDDFQKEPTTKYSFAVYNKGVGSNSILCKKWTHKRCSGVKGGLSRVRNFECSRCRKGDKPETESSGLELEQGVILERVGRFCYLGDIIEE